MGPVGNSGDSTLEYPGVRKTKQSVPASRSPLFASPGENKEHFLLTQPPPKSRRKKFQNSPLSLNRAGEPTLYLCPPPETLSRKLRPVTAGRQVFSPCFSLALDLVYQFNSTIKDKDCGKALLSLPLPQSVPPLGTVNWCCLHCGGLGRQLPAGSKTLRGSPLSAAFLLPFDNLGKVHIFYVLTFVGYLVFYGQYSFFGLYH